MQSMQVVNPCEDCWVNNYSLPYLTKICRYTQPQNYSENNIQNSTFIMNQTCMCDKSSSKVNAFVCDSCVAWFVQLLAVELTSIPGIWVDFWKPVPQPGLPCQALIQREQLGSDIDTHGRCAVFRMESEKEEVCMGKEVDGRWVRQFEERRAGNWLFFGSTACLFLAVQTQNEHSDTIIFKSLLGQSLNHIASYLLIFG